MATFTFDSDNEDNEYVVLELQDSFYKILDEMHLELQKLSDIEKEFNKQKKHYEYIVGKLYGIARFLDKSVDTEDDDKYVLIVDMERNK